MAFITVNGERVVWSGPGLPLVPFRVAIRAGTAEYRPAPINAENRQLRDRALGLLGGSTRLATDLAGLIQLTISAGRREHAAYFRPDGTVVGTLMGEPDSAQMPPRPAGELVGFVHTHPVPDTVLAPPSANDYDIPFAANPIQLVAEMGGRVWQVFQGGYCALLGSLAGTTFRRLTDPSADQVYLTVSGDSLRMEAFEAERQREREGAERRERAMRELAEQRRRDAEARRSALH